MSNATRKPARDPGTGGSAAPAPRKRDREATRAALLAAARLRFTHDGYDHTSVRDIAADVGVNQALVYRYFGSKDALFTEVSCQDDPLRELLDEPLENVPGVVLRRLLDTPVDMGADHPVIALLRSSGHAEARAILRERLRTDFTEGFAARLPGDAPEVRAELLAAWIVGLNVLRSVIGTPVLGSATPEELGPDFTRAVRALLGDDGTRTA